MIRESLSKCTDACVHRAPRCIPAAWHRIAPCTTVHHHLCAPAPWCITVVVHRIAPCTTVRDRPCAPALRCIIATLHQGARCSTMCDPARRGAACGGDDDSSSGAGSWEERPGLLQARADGARRGALSGGGVRHMLMQISPLSDLVRQVIWGLCWAASRGAPGRRTSGAKSKYSEIPPAFV